MNKATTTTMKFIRIKTSTRLYIKSNKTTKSRYEIRITKTHSTQSYAQNYSITHFLMRYSEQSSFVHFKLLHIPSKTDFNVKMVVRLLHTIPGLSQWYRYIGILGFNVPLYHNAVC